MFLVADRIDRSKLEPVLHSVRDAVIRHPVRLSVSFWDIRAAEMWLIVGSAQSLESLIGLIRNWREYSVGGAFAGRPALVKIVSFDDPVEKLGLWARLKKLFSRDSASEIETYSQAWLAEMPTGDGDERLVLEKLGRALEHGYDVIVLDRILAYLRPQVRFRVSAQLQELCNAEGLTVLALTDSGLEGWIAGDRCATLRSGSFEQVQRRDLDEFV